MCTVFIFILTMEEKIVEELEKINNQLQIANHHLQQLVTYTKGPPRKKIWRNLRQAGQHLIGQKTKQKP